jgi:hypothetical protein
LFDDHRTDAQDGGLMLPNTRHERMDPSTRAELERRLWRVVKGPTYTPDGLPIPPEEQTLLGVQYGLRDVWQEGKRIIAQDKRPIYARY